MDGMELSGVIYVTQYLRPDGRKRVCVVDVGEHHAEQAEGMVFSVEELPTGQVAIYARWDWQDEEEESIQFAKNGRGLNSPTNVLRRMIDELHKTKRVLP
jgi:hypothetical protein